MGVVNFTNKEVPYSKSNGSQYILEIQPIIFWDVVNYFF